MKLYEYLKNKHIKIYNKYIKHEFGHLISNETLSKDKFFYYLSQDKLYIEEYINLIQILLVKSNNDHQRTFIQQKILSFVNEENTFQKELLKEHKLDKIKRSTATTAYIGYLYEVAFKDDFLSLLIALSPCPIGYMEMMANIKQYQEINDLIYQKWLKIYQRKKVQTDGKVWKQFINKYDTDHISQEKLEHLENIFQTVVQLEINFFDQINEK